MTREVDYKVACSSLLPHKIIFCGTVQEMKNGLAQWRTRCDVTNQVKQAFFEHVIAEAKEFIKKDAEAKGFKQTFGIKGEGKVTIEVKPEPNN